MKLEYRITKIDSPFAPKAKYLFETAFPPEERPSFKRTVSWENSKFYSVFLNDEFVALADVVEYKDLVYLFFLAVSKRRRGQGIGRQILSDLAATHKGKRLFLLADELDEKYPDYDIRKKRLEFYAHNGFTDSGVRIKEFGVDYFLLNRDCAVSKQDFLDVMRYLIGDEMMRRFYENV